MKIARAQNEDQKTPDSVSRLDSNDTVQLSSPNRDSFQFMAENSPRVLQMRALQNMADRYLNHSEAAGSQGSEVLQGYFIYPNEKEFRLVTRYVEANLPDEAVRDFSYQEFNDEEVDLYRWISRNGFTIHDVYDWDDARSGRAFPTDIDYGLGSLDSPSKIELSGSDVEMKRRPSPPPQARGVPLSMGREAVRGTLDMVEDSEEELEEFATGISEAAYDIDELKALHLLLQQRRAPLDRRRRELLEIQFSDPGYEFSPGDLDFDFDRYSDYSDGTDTDGSDLEHDFALEDDDQLKAASASRMKRAKKLLKPHLTQDRLRKLASEDEKDHSKTIFRGGKRPNKEQLYRKEARFSLPGVKVGDRAKLPVKPTKKQQDDLATLNALLKLGVPISTAEKVIDSRFVVAQYRGLFYSKRSFDHHTRGQHRGLDGRDFPVFSTSALMQSPFGPAGYYYLSSQPGRDKDLDLLHQQTEKEARRIREVLLKKRSEEAAEETKAALGRNMDKSQAQSLGDLTTHLYTQDYDEFHSGLAENLGSSAASATPNPLAGIFHGLPNTGNPKVSAGDVPTHAARYAYGLKPYSGHEEEILEPKYDQSGKPKHPYSGKIYTSIHPLTDYEADIEPAHVVDLQKKKRINISQVILPEREAQFDGFIEPGRVKDQFLAKFPNFSGPYLESFEDLYGIDEALFNAFKAAFAKVKPGTEAFTFLESLLSNHLAQYSELRAIDAAIEAAAGQGAFLVYRTGSREFGFAPPSLSAGSGAESSSDIEVSSRAQKYEPSFILDLLKKLNKGAVGFEFSTPQASVGAQENEKGSGISSGFTLPPPPPALPAKPSARSSSKSSSSRGKSAEAIRQEAWEAAQIAYGEPINITGISTACYIRALVTAASRVHHLIEPERIETLVSALQDHLSFVNLRDRGQMINAGGLVAAEVRSALSQLLGTVFDPMVHVVMIDPNTGMLTDFTVNVGSQHVWLLYSPGHFDLIDRATP